MSRAFRRRTARRRRLPEGPGSRLFHSRSRRRTSESTRPRGRTRQRQLARANLRPRRRLRQRTIETENHPGRPPCAHGRASKGFERGACVVQPANRPQLCSVCPLNVILRIAVSSVTTDGGSAGYTSPAAYCCPPGHRGGSHPRASWTAHHRKSTSACAFVSVIDGPIVFSSL